MAAPNLNVEEVARLARLALTPEEIATYQSQLGRVLEHIEQLSRANIEGIEPTAHANPVFNVIREDEPAESLPRAAFLDLAPRAANNLLVVPKVIE